MHWKQPYVFTVSLDYKSIVHLFGKQLLNVSNMIWHFLTTGGIVIKEGFNPQELSANEKDSKHKYKTV